MNKILEMTMELIDALEDSDMIKNLKKSKDELLNDKEFLNKILKYQTNNDPALKEVLYQNINYQAYLQNYNELLFIVLKINQYYQDITNTKVCHNESN